MAKSPIGAAYLDSARLNQFTGTHWPPTCRETDLHDLESVFILRAITPVIMGGVVQPSDRLYGRPSVLPTDRPSVRPTVRPSDRPSDRPTVRPIAQPPNRPTARPPDRLQEHQPSTDRPADRPTTSSIVRWSSRIVFSQAWFVSSYRGKADSSHLGQEAIISVQLGKSDLGENNKNNIPPLGKSYLGH